VGWCLCSPFGKVLTASKSYSADRQFVVNDSVAKATARAGLEKLTVIVPRYKQVERLYLFQSDESEVSIQLRDAIIKLYANILSYQIQVARHLMRHFFQTFATAALNLDDWTAKLAKIQEADQQCKDFMANCDANLIANATASLHDRLTQLDDRINQRIADILTSHNTVGWNPGPNTDPGYAAVLYGGFQARAGFYRISLAQVDSDRTLFVMLRRGYEKRQHPIRVQLGWLNWFSVTRLEFVKVRFIPSRLQRTRLIHPVPNSKAFQSVLCTHRRDTSPAALTNGETDTRVAPSVRT
jgi:hypothetical protein